MQRLIRALMVLQSLFMMPIVEQVYLDPGYSGHANDIWRVKTAQEEVVVRILRDREPGGPFWKGCQYLFGLDPRNIFDLEEINAVLANVSPIPIPQVLRKGMVDGRPCVVVEYMPGSALDTFEWLPQRAPDCLPIFLSSHRHPEEN